MMMMMKDLRRANFLLCFGVASLGMLTHQVEFSQAIAHIYQPMPGSSACPSQADEEADAPEGSAACAEYEAIVQKLLDELKPELEQLETHILEPAEQLLEVIRAIRKMITKREHKKLDYDRHRNALRKLHDNRRDRTLRDEKQLYKLDNTLEAATEEYSRYNDLLKEELPRLFALGALFIQPLFQSFYYMQLNVYYALYQALVGFGKVGYFEMSHEDIEAQFKSKRGGVRDIAEALSIVHYKSGGGSGPSHLKTRRSSHQSDGSLFSGSSRSRGSQSLSSGGAVTSPQPASLDSAVHKVAGWQAHQQQQQHQQQLLQQQVGCRSQTGEHQQQQVKPWLSASQRQLQQQCMQQQPYDPRSSISTATLNSTITAGPSSSIGRKPNGSPTTTTTASAPRPPPPRRPKLPVETATALYPYEAQEAGDLSFKVGDVIEVSRRTQSANEWWTGRIKTGTAEFIEGQFPGNYVRLNGG